MIQYHAFHTINHVNVDIIMIVHEQKRTCHWCFAIFNIIMIVHEQKRTCHLTMLLLHRLWSDVIGVVLDAQRWHKILTVNCSCIIKWNRGRRRALYTSTASSQGERQQHSSSWGTFSCHWAKFSCREPVLRVRGSSILVPGGLFPVTEQSSHIGSQFSGERRGSMFSDQNEVLSGESVVQLAVFVRVLWCWVVHVRTSPMFSESAQRT